VKTILLSAAGAFVLAAAAFSGVAEAQCVWNGYAWSCAPAPAPGPYAAPQTPFEYQPFGYYPGRPAGPYAAFGAASHMGPNPGGGFYHMGSKYGQVD
jgi:hypothetical protein